MVNQAGLPEEPTVPGLPLDDIPVAQRDGIAVTPSPQTRRRWTFLGWLSIGVALALGLGSLMAFRSWEEPAPPSVSSPTLTTPANPSPTNALPDALLGHLPYKEAPASSLKPITKDGKVQLHVAAATRWTEMVQAARKDGVILVPLSGFRSQDSQNALFFERKAELGQRPMERASVSAPPGYSEHHTGYAIDIGDGTRSATNLELSFESTPAFHWLKTNAARFSFELSFPRNNPQGVSYEPWHWRFVGDRDSLETFYKARQLNPSPAPSPSLTP